ncbi:MAG TPA: histidinol-phosphate transaminase [Candidatus Omnitrophota bacterium]|nr:histidinol-phosphate transaminase [Candidatus Omnitrophota bacterium]
MKNISKPYIDQITPYVPGKPIEEVKRELGLRRVIKLASNENPLGTSRKVRRAIEDFADQVHLYPDGACFELRKTLASRLGVREKEIIFGNGSDELIDLLVKGFVREGDKVISSEKSFLEYELVSRVGGADFTEIPMQDFRFDLKAISAAIDAKTKIVFIANPNNPTGTYVSRPELDEFLDSVPQNVLICLDEAYDDFVEAEDFPDSLFYVKLERPNVIVLRTFSKSYGLAGLRIGYGIACAALIEYLGKVRQPFNVNSLAQYAALAALDDEDYLNKTKRVVSEGRDYLYRKLDRLKVKYIPSQANFILIDAEYNADNVFQALLRRGIVVRSMRAYGLKDYIRVSVGLGRENRCFVREFKRLIRQIRKGRPILQDESLKGDILPNE